MPTASTKSKARKPPAPPQSPANRGTGPAAGPNEPAATPASRLSPYAWRLASFVVLLGAALLRLVKLEINPLHHDEGVNGFFLLNLMRSGVYHYDPANYHGPTLYYFALPLTYALDQFHQLDTWGLRAVPALFGIGTVWLALALRRYLGDVGALAAGALIAVSPGAVYNSRYFIHEMLFVCFSLGLVVALLRFYEDENAPAASAAQSVRRDDKATGLLSAAAGVLLVGSALAAVYGSGGYFWFLVVVMLLALGGMGAALTTFDGPRANYLLLAAVCLGLLFATKETAFITVGVLVLAALLARIYVRLFNPPPRAETRRQERRRAPRAAAPVAPDVAVIARLGGWRHVGMLLIVALCVFLFVNIVYYSSFFTNAKGVDDALAAYDIWTKTGTSDFHRKPFYTYLEWLGREEAALLVLGTLGTLAALWRRRNRFVVFAGAWAFGMLAAYSLVPYKTPWLQLNVLVPLALVGGYAVEWYYCHTVRRGVARWRVLGPLGVALAVGLYQTYQINFVHYDDDSYVYVYAHTRRGYLDLLAQVTELAHRAGTGAETTINVASPDYWPMPWYLRDYKHVGYLGRVSPTSDALVITNINQEAEAQTTLGPQYRQVGQYPLRPGVTLLLYARRDLPGS